MANSSSQTMCSNPQRNRHSGKKSKGPTLPLNHKVVLGEAGNEVGRQRPKKLWHRRPRLGLRPKPAQARGGCAARMGTLTMKETVKSLEVSLGEILWAVVTIGSLVALFRCLVR